MDFKTYLKEFRYPGEVLESCVNNEGENYEEILNGFLIFTKEQDLKSDPNNFNSDQIERFINLGSDYRAATLNFRLTGQTAGVKKEYLKNINDYIYLSDYIAEVFEEDPELLSLKEEEARVIDLLIKEKYSENTEQLINMLNRIEKKFLSKKEKEYLGILIKASENIFSEKETEKLQSMGYTTLKIRKLNALSIKSPVHGRADKAWFLYLKEAFFGSEKLSEKEELSIKDKVSSRGRWKLYRRIETYTCMEGALTQERFNENAANINFAVSCFRTSHSELLADLDLDGTTFNSLQDKNKSDACIYHMYCSHDIEKLKKARNILKNISGTDHIYTMSPIKTFELCQMGVISKEEILEKRISVPQIIKISIKEPSKEGLFFLKNASEEDKKEASIVTDLEINLSGCDDAIVKDYFEELSEYFYRYKPEKYESFLIKALEQTKTKILSREEWEEILDFLASIRGKKPIIQYEKFIMTEEEFEAERKKAAAEEILAKEEKEIEEIKNYKTGDSWSWYKFLTKSKRIRRIAYERIKELKEYNSSAWDLVSEAFFDDIISDDEFLNYSLMRKATKKKEK